MRYSILVGNLKGRDHLEDAAVDRRIILECILWKQGVRDGSGWVPVAGSCEHGNEIWGFHNRREIVWLVEGRRRSNGSNIPSV
jgi:hypothetical protein